MINSFKHDLLVFKNSILSNGRDKIENEKEKKKCDENERLQKNIKYMKNKKEKRNDYRNSLMNFSFVKRNEKTYYEIYVVYCIYSRKTHCKVI